MKPVKYLETKIIPNKDLLTKKELVLNILTLQHLINSNNNHLIADTTVGAISILPMFTTSLNLAGDIALGIVAGSSAIKLGIDYINNTKLNKLYKLFVDELMNRFETPQLAYLEISNLIQSVEREDIINYFKLIGVDYNANK
jgi:hypothetical protein